MLTLIPPPHSTLIGSSDLSKRSGLSDSQMIDVMEWAQIQHDMIERLRSDPAVAHLIVDELSVLFSRLRQRR